jgi:hypothetical protein
LLSHCELIPDWVADNGFSFGFGVVVPIIVFFDTNQKIYQTV